MEVPVASRSYSMEQGCTGSVSWPPVTCLPTSPAALAASPPPGLPCPYQDTQFGPATGPSQAPPPFCMTERRAPPPILGMSWTQQPTWSSLQYCSYSMHSVPSSDPLSCSNAQLPDAGSPHLEYGASSPSSESRYGLDPQLLPSAVQVMEEDETEWQGKVFVSEPSCVLPPLPTTDYEVEDRGNASPGFIRCTTYAFPTEGLLAQQSHLPLGAIVAPLAKLEDSRCPLPICDGAADKGHVPGCGECGAHMCPHMVWQDCGQRFHCPFCGKVNEVPWQCYQPTNRQGMRVDSQSNPQLTLGSYEVLDTQMAQPAVLLLAVNISAPAVRGGQLEHICQELRSMLVFLSRNKDAQQLDLKVGLMTYDRRLHLYDFSPALSNPHMMIITEVEELELPVWDGLLVPLRDAQYSLDSVLQQIPQLVEESEDSPALLELPVHAALQIMQALGCIGKLLIFHSAPLTEGSVKRSASGFFNRSKPKSLFHPPETGLSLAKECVSQGCSVHLFLFSQREVGGAWPGYIPYLTGGQFFSYSSLQSEVDKEQLTHDLRQCVKSDTAYKAELKVFVSKGLRVFQCYGEFIPGPDPSHISMAALDWHTALAVEFTHSSALDDQRGVVIQTVLSYTSARGERKMRVHSLRARCSPHLLDAFRNCQAQTLLTFYCKRMYCGVLERPPQELREELQIQVTRALACYRKYCCSSAATQGQLVLPQFLKAFPVYLNSLRKSEVLLPSLRSSVPQRLQLRSRLVAMDTRSTALHFYPLVLRLPESELGSAQAVRCSASSLDPEGLYLAHGPLVLLLWVGRDARPTVLRQLFNTPSFTLLSAGKVCLPVLENPLSISVRNFIDTLQSRVPYTPKLTVVKQGETSEEMLQPFLVEDKSPNGGASYADFLYHLHVNSMRLLL